VWVNNFLLCTWICVPVCFTREFFYYGGGVPLTNVALEVKYINYALADVVDRTIERYSNLGDGQE